MNEQRVNYYDAPNPDERVREEDEARPLCCVLFVVILF